MAFMNKNVFIGTILFYKVRLSW